MTQKPQGIFCLFRILGREKIATVIQSIRDNNSLFTVCMQRWQAGSTAQGQGMRNLPRSRHGPTASAYPSKALGGSLCAGRGQEPGIPATTPSRSPPWAWEGPGEDGEGSPGAGGCSRCTGAGLMEHPAGSPGHPHEHKAVHLPLITTPRGSHLRYTLMLCREGTSLERLVIAMGCKARRGNFEGEEVLHPSRRAGESPPTSPGHREEPVGSGSSGKAVG